jgi:hypothetical protein
MPRTKAPMVVKIGDVEYLFTNRDMFKMAKSMVRNASVSGGVFTVRAKPEVFGVPTAPVLCTGLYIVDAAGQNVCNDPNCPGC